MKKWLLIGMVLMLALSGVLGCSRGKSETPGEGKLVTAGTVQIPDGPKIKVVFNGPPELEVSWQELGTTGIYGWVIQLDGTLKNVSNEIVTFSEIAYLLDGYQVAYDNGPSTYGQVLAPREEMRVLKGVDIYSEKTKILEVKINGFEKIGGPATTPPPTPAPTPTLAPANFSSWAEAAISWAKAKGGSYEWYDEEKNQGYCLRFVANAFRQRGPEPEGEWRSAWEASQNLTLHHEEVQRAPRGSLIFFDKTDDNPYGHVGIYLGNGKLIHAYGRLRIDGIGQLRNLDKGRLIGSYMGWAYPPEKWRPALAENSKGSTPEEVVMLWLNLLKEGKFPEAEELYTPNGKEDIEIAGGLEKVWKVNQIEKIEIIRTEYEGPRYEANEAHVYVIFYLTDGTKVSDEHFNFYKVDNQWKIDDLYGCYPGLD